MQLLQDTFVIENLQILTEGKNSDVMKIKGVFGRCNEKNNNGRIYPTSVLQSQLEKVTPLISERRLCGELDHPQNDTVKLSNASHLITHLEMKGHELIGEAELLKTPAGLTAQALITGGVKIGISSRGMGTLSEDHNGDKIVNEDFKLVTFDLVADPSTRGAYPCLSESTEGKFARETQNKLQKEDNFVTLLKSKMRQVYEPFIEEASEQDAASMSAKQFKDSTDAAKRKAHRKGTHASRQRVETHGLVSHSEPFKLVKADGHWHRMAYALKDRLHEFTTTDLLSKAVSQESPTSPKKREGFIRRGLRHGSEVRQAKRLGKVAGETARSTEVQTAHGSAEGESIKARGRAAAQGTEDRETARQSTRTRVAAAGDSASEAGRTAASREAGGQAGSDAAAGIDRSSMSFQAGRLVNKLRGKKDSGSGSDADEPLSVRKPPSASQKKALGKLKVTRHGSGEGILGNKEGGITRTRPRGSEGDDGGNGGGDAPTRPHKIGDVDPGRTGPPAPKPEGGGNVPEVKKPLKHIDEPLRLPAPPPPKLAAVKRTKSNIQSRRKDLEKILALRKTGKTGAARGSMLSRREKRRSKWMSPDAGKPGGVGSDIHRLRAGTEYHRIGSLLAEIFDV